MSILKLEPSFKDYLWGGTKLKEEFNKNYSGDILAESWELSCHKDGPSVISNGKYEGKTLKEYIEIEGKSVLGKNSEKFEDFPILIKFIDAKDNLSIQVHPDDEYALKYENQYGKTEVWYIVDCKEGAYLYYGFSKDVSKEEFEERIKNNTLLEVLNKVYVQKGDVLFIEAGTIHAICKDIIVAEIQQNSNITYRVYDYARVGIDGKQRELHIDKAIQVTNTQKLKRVNSVTPHIAQCKYFTVDKIFLDGKITKKIYGKVSTDSFLNILVLDGKGEIICNGETQKLKKGDSFFIPAKNISYEIVGECEALLTTI